MMMNKGRIVFAWFTALMIMLGFPCSCKANVFVVGGKDGWVVNPSERYDHWAERNRFQVNDTLLFKYPKGSDSVLVVTRDDFASCNTKNPIQTLTDGESRFIFDRPGPFFFISGNPSNCNAGQKLLVTVLAVRAPPPNPTKQLLPPPPATVSAPPPPGQVAQPPETASGPSSSRNSSSLAPAPAKNSASSVVSGLASHLAFSSVAVSMAMFIVVRV